MDIHVTTGDGSSSNEQETLQLMHKDNNNIPNIEVST